MKSKHSRLEQKAKNYHFPTEDWQLDQDEAKELERRQQVLQGLNELNQSDPGGARAIPDIVFHNISSSRQRQLAEEYPARDSQSASKGHLDYVGAIKEGLNDEEFATLENSLHAYISLPAELQQKWQGDLWASKPDSDEYKTRGQYERAHTVWTAEGLCSLKKLAEEAQAAGYQHSESKPKPAAKPEVIPEPKQQGVEPQPQPIVKPEIDPEPKQQGVEPQPQPIVEPETNPEPKQPDVAPKSEPQPQQQEPEKEQPESPTGGKSRGEGQGNAKLTQEKAEDAPNPAGEKNWDSIENRRAVVRRLTMLGRNESTVVQEAMVKSVYREYCLARLAVLESDGKAGSSLKKRREELDDDLERARNISGKFSNYDTGAILKVISNFSYEQMDDLDKLVDGVAILAEEDPQGMERLCSDVAERRYELHKKVDEIAFSDSLSTKEKYKREADLAGNFNSSIIAQTREAREAAEAVTGKSKPKQSSATSQPEPAPQPRPETNPKPKSKGEFQPQPQQQKSEKEQPESPTRDEGKGEKRHSAEGEKQPEDDRQRLLREMHELGGRGEMLVADTMIDRLPLSGGEELHNLRGYQGVSFVREDADDGSTSHYRAIPGTKYIMNDYAIADEECFSDELVDLGLRVVDDLHRIPENRRESALVMALR